MKYEDGWKDGILAMMGTMSLQLNQAHNIIEELNAQVADYETKFRELEEALAETVEHLTEDGV